MKVIELNHNQPTLDEVIEIAEQELVVLRKPNGTVFAVSAVDDLELEAELLKRNPEFMKLMDRLSKEKGTISLEELRRELAV